MIHLFCEISINRTYLLAAMIIFALAYVGCAINFITLEKRIRYMFQFSDLAKSGDRVAKLGQTSSYLFVGSGLLILVSTFQPIICGR